MKSNQFIVPDYLFDISYFMENINLILKLPANSIIEIMCHPNINHNGDFNTAKGLIDEASQAGATAVKLQTYITEKRVSKDSPIFGILKQCELTFKDQEELFKYAGSKDIEIFSTPFDEESVEFLASINTPCYKIASFDLVNKKLLKKVAEQGRPVIMSRGMASQEEIDTSFNIVKDSGVDIVLLHCISAYPVPSHTSLHLDTINALKDRYNCPVGFSDHTMGIDAAKYAVAAGACVIEKHFTLSRASKGPDHALSTEPQEMKELVKGVGVVAEMMGKAVWSPVPAEKEILQYRRIS